MNSIPESLDTSALSFPAAASCGRTALVTASAGLAFPHLRGQAPRREGAGEGIRVGVIGVGGQGKSHLDAPTMAKNVVAICDVDRNHLAAMKTNVERRAGRAPATYARITESCSRARKSMRWLIATPDQLQRPAAIITAFEAGEGVYVEKSLTLTVHEGWQ